MLHRLAISLLAAVSLLALARGEARAEGSYSAAATRTEAKIKIDGTMDEGAWKSAPALGQWRQTRVTPGAPARERTEVKILYDRKNLYFGFHCFDSRPDKIAAYTVQNEAFLHQDDNVTVIIDTHLDHRNAYYFWTNPLGVRTDGRIVNDGEEFSTDWQGEWEAQGSIVADGWIVEIRIPFSNFQYGDAPEHTFGLLLDREQNSLQEWSNWTPDGVNSAKVSRYSHLTGLKDIAPRSMFGITGYAAASLQMGPGHDPRFRPNAGFDARFSPAPWLDFKLTVNPDYAQVDVDQDVLWLDTIERPIPERRPFFLEGGDLFVSPIRLFHSRRVAPRSDDRVLAGLQAVGKRDGYGFSALDVQTMEHRPDGSFQHVNSAVVRAQKDISKRSSVSAVALSRIGDEKHGVGGIDANLHVWDEFFFLGQVAKSFGPAGNGSAEAYHAEIHRFDTNSELWLQYQDIGKSFDNPLGYIPSTDRRSVYLHGNYTWFTKREGLPRVDAMYDDNWQTNHAGVEQRQVRELSLIPYMTDDFAFLLDGKYFQSIAGSPGGAAPDPAAPTSYYDDFLGAFGLLIQPNEWQSAQMAVLSGTFLGGNFLALKAAANFKIGNHLAFMLNGFYTLSWDLPPGSPLIKTMDNGHQWALYGQVRYQFSPDLYTRLTFQRGQVAGITDLGGVAGQVLDAVIGWHYRVGSDAFLVYTQQPVGGVQEHQILTKVSLTY